MRFVDTHAHLDDPAFDEDRDEVLGRAQSSGVEHFINIGHEPSSWERSIQIAASRQDISISLGLHPQNADDWSNKLADQLNSLVVRHRPVAIGETGLDFYRDRADRDSQRLAFRDQLALARSAGLPVIIHMRGEVEPELMETLSSFTDLKIVLHSFDGSAQLRDWALDYGAYFGFGGLATRPASTELRSLLQTVPLDRFILETDSPYLSPVGWARRRNSPESVPEIATVLADLKLVGLDEVANRTTSTAQSVFSLVRLPDLKFEPRPQT
jgi:TatD DNase family protein